jgi:hypothetical protein
VPGNATRLELTAKLYNAAKKILSYDCYMVPQACVSILETRCDKASHRLFGSLAKTAIDCVNSETACECLVTYIITAETRFDTVIGIRYTCLATYQMTVEATRRRAKGGMYCGKAWNIDRICTSSFRDQCAISHKITYAVHLMHATSPKNCLEWRLFLYQALNRGVRKEIRERPRLS